MPHIEQGGAASTGGGSGGGGSLTTQHNELGADITGVAAGTWQTVFSDAFAVGTWDIYVQVGISPGNTTTVSAARLLAGTATATIQGPAGGQISSPAAGNCVTAGFRCRVVVTAAGTLLMQGLCVVGCTIKQFYNEGGSNVQATGYVAVKVA